MACPCYLGLFSVCEPIDTGLQTTQVGQYYLQFFTNGSYFYLTYQSSSIGENILIDEFRLNLNSVHVFTVLNPDGTQYSTEGCTEFSLEVRFIPEAPPPPPPLI